MIPHPSSGPRAAFSLIEAMISITLGIFILLVVYAGFQQMLSSMQQAKRMALKNRLLTAGIFRALEEADFWTSMDNPGHQPLRTTPTDWKSIAIYSGGYLADATDWLNLPQPFNTFRETKTAAYVADLYDARYFQSFDKRSWFRGDSALYFAESGKYNYESAYGNYSIFTNASDNVVLVGNYDPGISKFESKEATWESYLIVPASHRWLSSMNKSFKYTLGWYGWFDYLPANAFLDYYDVYGDYGKLGKDNKGGGNNVDGVDPDNPGRRKREDTDPTYDDEVQDKFRNGSGATTKGCKPWELRELPPGTEGSTVVGTNRHGRFCLQKTTSYVSPLSKSGAERAVTPGWYLYTTHIGISAPRPQLSTETAAQYTAVKRAAAAINRYMGCGFNAGPELINTFPVLLGSLNQQQDLETAPPASWPRVTFGVRRFMKWGTISTVCYIRMIDRITGEDSELQFPVIGTTFRGARLQRRMHPDDPTRPYGLDYLDSSDYGASHVSNTGLKEY
jgi:hypothetical protein